MSLADMFKRDVTWRFKFKTLSENCITSFDGFFLLVKINFVFGIIRTKFHSRITY